MKETIVFLLLLFMWTSACSLPVDDDNQIDVEDILSQVPQTERKEFFKENVRKGYQVLHKTTTPPTKESSNEDISVAFYKHALEAYPVTDKRILRLLRNIICFDDGTCIDIGDVGIHPFFEEN